MLSFTPDSDKVDRPPERGWCNFRTQKKQREPPPRGCDGTKKRNTRRQLGEVTQDGCRAVAAGKIHAPAPECCSGVWNKPHGQNSGKQHMQATFPLTAVWFGSVWTCAEFLGVQVQHLCKQQPLPVQVRALIKHSPITT